VAALNVFGHRQPLGGVIRAHQLDVMNDSGRIALCGAITGPDNMANIITRALTLTGLTLGGYLHLSPEFSEKMAGWFAEGRIAYDETIVDGIENTVDAFLDMMHGANTGKMLVRIGDTSD